MAQLSLETRQTADQVAAMYQRKESEMIETYRSREAQLLASRSGLEEAMRKADSDSLARQRQLQVIAAWRV